MRYCFTTLAVGEPYEQYATDLFLEMNQKTTEGAYYIVGNDEFSIPDPPPGLFVKNASMPQWNMGTGGFDFYFNAKVLGLKFVLDQERLTGEKHDYVFYVDGDWQLHTGFEEEKILSMLDFMDTHNFDFLFERPAQIKDSKEDPKNSFFCDKLYDYHVFDHSRWDEAHCVNEQFLVFKNGPKFKYFVQRWEQFLWYSIANKIRNYAEGFEIGVSALEANMNWEFRGVFGHFLRDCFKFYAATGQLHFRY